MEAVPLTHLDTNLLVRLFEGAGKLVPARVRDRLEEDELRVSAMVELELAYLYEIGRLSSPPARVFEGLAPVLDLRVSEASFAAVVRHAVPLRWTRDPFDRIIVANALADGAALLTSDADIRANFPQAVWDDA